MGSLIPYILVLIAFLFPSIISQQFNGLPFSHWAEFSVLLLILPFLFSSELRRKVESLFRAPALFRLFFYGLSGFLLLFKAVLLVAGEQEGFIGCYSSPAEWAVTDSGTDLRGECERSYEDPFRLSGATRIDQTIDFNPDSWNLVFLNSLRYDYSEEAMDSIPRDRIPLDVIWRGKISLEEAAPIVVQYVGEGNLRIGESTFSLPPSYEQPDYFTVDLPAGSRDFVLEYSFNDQSRTGQDENSRGPGAQIRMIAAGDNPGEPLRAQSAGVAQGILAFVCDLALVLVVFPMAVVVVKEIVVDQRVLLSVVVFLCVSYALPFSDRIRELCMIMGLIGFWLWHCLRAPFRPMTLFLALSFFSSAIILVFLPGPARVVLRNAWDDPLKHESEAYSILTSGSLEAGEKTFYAQPMYRYVKFAEHAVFGDGEALYCIAQLGFFLGGAFHLVDSVIRRDLSGWRKYLLGFLGSLFLFLGGYYVSIVIRTGLSEYLTWSLFLWVIPIIGFGGSATAITAAMIALAFSFTVGTNQLFAVLYMMVLGFLLLWRKNVTLFFLGLMAVAGIMLLPLLHNWHYGGALVFTTTSLSTAQNLPLPPAIWITFLQGDSAAAAAVAGHVRLLLLLADVPLSTRLILLPMAAGFLVWVFASGYSLIRKRLSDCLLLSIPLFYLAPHLFFDVKIYYPRLFFIGYLAMLAVVGIWLARKPSKAF
jgi:hypothetical protein